MKSIFQYVILLLTVAPTVSLAQERCPLKGKLVSSFDDLEGIYIINKNSERSTITSSGGYFIINAADNDTLIISSVQFKATELLLSPELTSKELLLVPIEPRNRELDELVIIDYSYINSVSLGLVPADQRILTPAERRLETANSFRQNPLGLDPIFNAFSGRTKMLKGAVETEKKESLMEKINYIYSEEDIVSKLNIPIDYVRGFVFFAVENKYFAKAVKEKNDEMARFMITGLAKKYLALLNESE